MVILRGGSEAATPWWLMLLEGIAAVVIGFLLLTEPGSTLFTIAVFLGVYWLLTGVVDLVMLFVDRSRWGWKLFSGVVGVLAGLVIIRHPWWAAVLVPTTLVWVLGIMGIVIGLATFARAFFGGGWAAALLGVISVLLGALLLFKPLVSTLVLLSVLGIWAIVGGVAAIAGALWLRGRQLGARPPAGRPIAHA